MYIGLHRGKGFISKAIKWQTRSEYSHASFIFSDGKVFESREGKGVRFLNYMPPDQDVDYYEILGLDEDTEQKIKAWCLGKIGEAYDYSGVFRFISRRRYRDNNKWFCSEIVFHALKIHGIVLLNYIESWETSPALLRLSLLLKKIDGSPTFSLRAR